MRVILPGANTGILGKICWIRKFDQLYPQIVTLEVISTPNWWVVSHPWIIIHSWCKSHGPVTTRNKYLRVILAGAIIYTQNPGFTLISPHIYVGWSKLHCYDTVLIDDIIILWLKTLNCKLRQVINVFPKIWLPSFSFTLPLKFPCTYNIQIYSNSLPSYS